MRYLLVVTLLVLHAGLVLGSAWLNFVTVDEVGFIPSGPSHWHTGPFLMYRVNPPLPRLLATAAVALADPVVDYRGMDDRPGVRCEWQLGPEFALANAPRYRWLVFLARLAGAGWSVLGACLVYRWAGA